MPTLTTLGPDIGVFRGYVFGVTRVQAQVGNVIIAGIAVNMVNNFSRLKITPQVLLHNQAMLKDVLCSTARIGWVRVIVGSNN